jgi:hypothetical protein
MIYMTIDFFLKSFNLINWVLILVKDF